MMGLTAAAVLTERKRYAENFRTAGGCCPGASPGNRSAAQRYGAKRGEQCFPEFGWYHECLRPILAAGVFFIRFLFLCR